MCKGKDIGDFQILIFGLNGLSGHFFRYLTSHTIEFTLIRANPFLHQDAAPSFISSGPCIMKDFPGFYTDC